MKEKKSEK